MSLTNFTTDRLTLRDWSDDLNDPAKRAALDRALNSVITPPVLAPLPPPLQLANETDPLMRWITDRAAESEVSLICDTASGEILGLLILAIVSDAPAKVHLGYLFAQPAWGKGYATEVLSGLVAQAAVHAPVTLIGGVAHDNPASARVLTKTGFARDAAQSTSDTDMFVLQLA